MMRERYWQHLVFHSLYFHAIHDREMIRAVLVHELETTGKTQKQLAEEIGVAPSTLRAVLAGRMLTKDTRRVLLAWANKPAYWQAPYMWVTNGEVALTAVAELFPPGRWREERRLIARRLAETYRERGEDVPDWVEEGEHR